MIRLFEVGDKIRVVERHPWAAGMTGIIDKIQQRKGNRYVVKFDEPMIGFYCEEVQVVTVNGTVKRKGPNWFLRLSEVDMSWMGGSDDE